MNIPLFRQIQEIIKARPVSINMIDFVTHRDRLREFNDPLCQTVACICGWACEISGLKPDRMCGYVDRGMLALDITRVDAWRLFYTFGWPPEFKREMTFKYELQEVIDAINDNLFFGTEESRNAYINDVFYSELDKMLYPTHDNITDHETYANIVSDRIDWFIEKDGAN